MIILLTDPAPSPLRFCNVLYSLLRNWKFLAFGGSIIVAITLSGILVRRVVQSKRKLRRKIPNSTKKAHYPGQISDAEFPKYPGLLNRGNSCYLNSILQALAATHVNLHLETLQPTPFVISLDKILGCLNIPTGGALDTSDLIRSMGGSLNNDQQDAHELLQAMFGALSRYRNVTEIASNEGSVPNYSLLRKKQLLPWEGLIGTKLQCHACNQYKAVKVNEFSILSFQVTETLEDSFNKFILPEIISDYRCECGLVGQCSRISSIIRWPEILVIHIQRLTQNYYGSSLKNDEHVGFPLIMESWKQEYHVFGRTNVTMIYDLASVVEHHGGCQSGHYTTKRRVFTQNHHVRWINFSDTSSKDVPIENVMSSSGYLLFYVKRSSTE